MTNFRICTCQQSSVNCLGQRNTSVKQDPPDGEQNVSVSLQNCQDCTDQRF